MREQKGLPEALGKRVKAAAKGKSRLIHRMVEWSKGNDADGSEEKQ